MFHVREECGEYRQGINFTKTCYGHALVLVIGRVKIGYYWGKKFNSRIGLLSA